MTAMGERPALPVSEPALHALFRDAQVGRCVNSVTHDVNNYLGAIMAYAELVELESELNEEAKRMMGEIVAAVRKSADLLEVLTVIARPGHAGINSIDPLALVKKTVALKEFDLRREQVRFELEHPAEMGMILGDEPNLIRALLYMLLNALQHVDPNDKNIRVKVYETDESVEIDVWNSGDGVAEVDRPQIFEPYFTKGDGAHAGLGLTHARNIAQDHGGDVSYDEQRGFVMRLPRSRDASA